MTQLQIISTQIDGRRRRVRQEGLIGIGIHGLHQPHGMSSLRGEAAMLELDRDHKKFCQGHPSRRTKDMRNALAAFRRVVDSVLSLDSNAVLSNGIDGSYDGSLREDGFRLVEHPGHLQMVHRVFLPYLPGGYRQVKLHAEVADAGLRVWVETYIDYFEGDAAGREASLNDGQDETTKTPLDAYIQEALRDPELVQAALDPQAYEDSPNAWKSLDARGLKRILDSNKALTSSKVNDPLDPRFDSYRAEMFETRMLKQVNYSIAFLSAFTPTKTPTRSVGELASKASMWSAAHSDTLRNGALAAAAIHLGLITEEDRFFGLTIGISRPEYQWIEDYEGTGAFRRQKPRGWDTFLGRKHLFE